MHVLADILAVMLALAYFINAFKGISNIGKVPDKLTVADARFVLLITSIMGAVVWFVWTESQFHYRNEFAEFLGACLAIGLGWTVLRIGKNRHVVTNERGFAILLAYAIQFFVVLIMAFVS